MPVMEWSDELVLDSGVIDDTHKEFVDLLNRVYDAPDDQLLSVLDEFISHTEAHFAQEQRWMEELAFPPLHCHVGEHEGVMEISREVRRRTAEGDARYGKILAQGVAEWFANHAASMDLVLAQYIKEQGYVATAGKE
jgi:hemerythrin-like metal-binding protein